LEGTETNSYVSASRVLRTLSGNIFAS